MKGNGFLNFYIALITGSILEWAEAIYQCSFAVYSCYFRRCHRFFRLIYLTGVIIGYGGKEALFFIGIPIGVE